jgi:hypothetical protein
MADPSDGAGTTSGEPTRCTSSWTVRVLRLVPLLVVFATVIEGGGFSPEILEYLYRSTV